MNACATAPKKTRTTSTPIPHEHVTGTQRPGIPLVMNDQVQDWLDYFQGRGRSSFEIYLKRSGKYIPMMSRILKEQGLPDDLIYLSMIESGFNPRAYSHAAASGAWQFIRQTGLRYGLKVDSWVDERRDPEKATLAASKYLRDLYDRYNDWYLAAAGYNAGEGKIDNAIRKYATEDFWEIAQGRYLQEETKDYVPKLIAASILGKNPEKYGFHVEYESPIVRDTVVLNDPIDLRVAAECVGITYEEMKDLNPELLRWITPPSKEVKGYRLNIPKGSTSRFYEKHAQLKPYQRMGKKVITVSSPETISKLARKEGVSPILLAAANDISVDDMMKPW